MINQKMHNALDGIINKWRRTVFAGSGVLGLNESYKFPYMSLLPSLATIKYLEKPCVSCSLHSAPIYFAIMKEYGSLMHIALVNVRVMPISQNLTIPSQSECRHFSDLIAMVYTELRHKRYTLSANWNENMLVYPGKSFLVSMGYIQIGSSLTSMEFLPIDTAQGVTIDYIADTSISDAEMVASIKSMNHEYVQICQDIMRSGKV